MDVSSAMQVAKMAENITPHLQRQVAKQNKTKIQTASAQMLQKMGWKALFKLSWWGLRFSMMLMSNPAGIIALLITGIVAAVILTIWFWGSVSGFYLVFAVLSSLCVFINFFLSIANALWLGAYGLFNAVFLAVVDVFNSILIVLQTNIFNLINQYIIDPINTAPIIGSLVHLDYLKPSLVITDVVAHRPEDGFRYLMPSFQSGGKFDIGHLFDWVNPGKEIYTGETIYYTGWGSPWEPSEPVIGPPEINPSAKADGIWGNCDWKTKPISQMILDDFYPYFKEHLHVFRKVFPGMAKRFSADMENLVNTNSGTYQLLVNTGWWNGVIFPFFSGVVSKLKNPFKRQEEYETKKPTPNLMIKTRKKQSLWMQIFSDPKRRKKIMIVLILLGVYFSIVSMFMLPAFILLIFAIYKYDEPYAKYLYYASWVFMAFSVYILWLIPIYIFIKHFYRWCRNTIFSKQVKFLKKKLSLYGPRGYKPRTVITIKEGNQ